MGQNPTSVTSIVMDEASKSKVDEMAQSDRRDRSAQICWLIEQEYARRERRHVLAAKRQQERPARLPRARRGTGGQS